MSGYVYVYVYLRSTGSERSVVCASPLPGTIWPTILLQRWARAMERRRHALGGLPVGPQHATFPQT